MKEWLITIGIVAVIAAVVYFATRKSRPNSGFGSGHGGGGSAGNTQHPH